VATCYEALVKSKSKGHLFVVSGPSGSGKTTLIEKLLKEDGNTVFSVSYTTRSPRPNEQHGKDYYFTDAATFERMIAESGFLEWENVHGYLYGTPVREVTEPLEKGIDVVLDIDVKGALRVKERCPQACLIFIEPPSVEELTKRLSIRGEKEIEKRMERVKEEMEKKHLFTFTVRNDNVFNAFKDFRSIISSVRGQSNGENHR
jgi:guanylate kinase